MATVKESTALAEKLHDLSFDAKEIGYESISDTLENFRDQLMRWGRKAKETPTAPPRVKD